jgi:hypothetical protein
VIKISFILKQIEDLLGPEAVVYWDRDNVALLDSIGDEHEHLYSPVALRIHESKWSLTPVPYISSYGYWVAAWTGKRWITRDLANGERRRLKESYEDFYTRMTREVLRDRGK